MALVYIVVGVCLLMAGVIWNVDSDGKGAGKTLGTTLLVIVGLACIIMSFLLAGGVKF